MTHSDALQAMPRGVCPSCRKSFWRPTRRSRDSGRFCSRTCSFRWRRVQAEMAAAKRGLERRQKIDKRCIVCADNFTAARPNQVICSADCRRQRAIELVAARSLRVGTRTCKHCGAAFEISYRDRRSRFCSRSCGRLWSRRHAQQAAEAEAATRDPVRCRQCGVSFTPLRGTKRTTFCAARCCRKWWRREWRRRARERRRGMGVRSLRPSGWDRMPSLAAGFAQLPKLFSSGE